MVKYYCKLDHKYDIHETERNMLGAILATLAGKDKAVDEPAFSSNGSEISQDKVIQLGLNFVDAIVKTEETTKPIFDSLSHSPGYLDHIGYLLDQFLEQWQEEHPDETIVSSDWILVAGLIGLRVRRDYEIGEIWDFLAEEKLIFDLEDIKAIELARLVLMAR